MDALTGVLALLSTDQELHKQIHGYCLRWGYPIPIHFSDPVQLTQALPPKQGTGLRANHFAGAVLDLTVPNEGIELPPWSFTKLRGLLGPSHDLDLAWCLVSVLPVARNISSVPFILVGSRDWVGDALRSQGMPVVAQVPPRAADSVWQRALSGLFSEHPIFEASAGSSERLAGMGVETMARLHATLYVDVDRCALLSDGQCIPLTAQEVRVMALLVRSPRRFHAVDELARHLSTGGRFPVDRHSVEQTVSGLRRKMGETAKSAQILVSRRGLGYALFPQDA